MHTLVYNSSAVCQFAKDDLIAILTHACEKNARLNLTGILLYKDGCFLQALEGEKEAVHALYATIKEDKRHKGVMTLLEMPIEKRAFPDWTMAFHNLNDPEIEAMPGYNEFMNVPLNARSLQQQTGQVQRLLMVFHRMHTGCVR